MQLNKFEQLFKNITIERGVSSDYFTLRRTDTALHNRLSAIEITKPFVRQPASSLCTLPLYKPCVFRFVSLSSLAVWRVIQPNSMSLCYWPGSLALIR